MKTMKKILAFVLASAMTLAMSVTAFADTKNDYEITINNAKTGHTYEAYQILKGDLSNDQKTLSNVEWGSGVNKESIKDLGNAEDYANSLANVGDNSAAAIEAANVLNGYLSNPTGVATAPVNGVYKITGLEAGYYLIKDKDKSLEQTTESYTSFILKIVKSVEVNPKADTTTVEKKVKDTNDTTGEVTDWQDSADYDIGDVVPFKLTANLANNVDSYKKYKLVFHDTISEGLTYNKDARIYIDNKDVTEGFTVKYEGTSLTFACDDVKALGAHSGSTVVVEYNATLNEKAVLGSAGNPNKVYLEFSNNPNLEGEGTGKTPEDTVIVFTYKVVVNKVNQDNEPLAGAEFTLYKKMADGNLNPIKAIMSVAGTQFEFKGLDDGDYVLKETKTPDGYNTIDDIEFTVTAEHEIISDNPALISLNGNVTTGEITFTPNVTEGSLDTTVINKKGSILPETGGAGRVFIYVLGAVLVLGAGVILVSKRRVSR